MPTQTNDTPLAFWDVLPTLCELTGAQPPAGIDGISFLSALLGTGPAKAREFLYWEFPAYGGQQAVIAGDWKAVRQQLQTGKVVTELYNLKDDRSESTNVAAKHPEVVARLEAILKREHTPSATFPLPAIDAAKR